MKNNKPQTAVKWYDNEIEKLFNQFTIDKINIYEFRTKRFKLLEQAKEMEKNQMINFSFHYADEWFDKVYLEKEYNETYGGGNK